MFNEAKFEMKRKLIEEQMKIVSEIRHCKERLGRVNLDLSSEDYLRKELILLENSFTLNLNKQIKLTQ